MSLPIIVIRQLARSLVLLALLLGTAPALVPSAGHDLAAQARDVSIERFHVEVQVDRDGSFLVTETLDIRFQGSWSIVERDLSHDHRTAQDRRARLHVSMEAITDGDGRSLEVEEERITQGRRYIIHIPDAVDATRRLVLRYRVQGGLRFFEEGSPEGYFDELYWNATGNDWEMPIESAGARVILPDGVTGIQAWGYTGPVDSEEQAVETQTHDQVAEIEATRSLAPREGLTISVTWDPGVVDRPGALARGVDRVRALWPLGLPLVALLGMFAAWRKKGRDPDRRSIMVEYEPPEDLSPAEVGTLVDHKAEMHDITATLVDLAVRGYLTIEEEERKGILGLGGSTEYIFHLQKPPAEWSQLRPHELRYLHGLFPPAGTPTSATDGIKKVFSVISGKKDAQEVFSSMAKGAAKGGSASLRFDPEVERRPSVKLSDLQNRFYRHLEGITTAIYARLKEKGLYDKRPDKATQAWMALGFMVLMASAFLGILALDPPALLARVAPDPLPTGLGLGISGVIILAFGSKMGVRTEAGVRALEASLGFKEFLERVESPRYKRMITSPELFEEYLPFAMAFQVEDRWAKAFDDLYRQPPDWYRGSAARTGAFSASAFSRQMRGLSTSANRTMASSPSGSSSGSGGGGRSGGGSGGGGGRAR